MWVSKKKWDALLKRVDQLESDTGLRASSYGYLFKGQHIDHRVAVSEVVSRLANEIGLIYKPGCGPTWEVEKKAKR